MPIPVPVEARPDEGSFKRAADQITQTFGAAGQDAGKSFSKSFGDGAKLVQQAAASYEKALDGVADASGRAKAAEAERQRQAEKSEALAKRLKDAEESLRQARDTGDTKAQTAAERELERVREQSARATSAVVRNAEAAERNRRAESRATRDAVQAYRDLEEAQRRASLPSSSGPGVFSGLASQSSGIIGQFSSLGGSAGKGFVAGAAAVIVGQALFRVGAQAAGALADGFKAVMDTGLGFERTVNNFRGVTEATEDQARRMSATARQLGSDTTLAGASASDAASAMTELAKAGFTVDQAMAAARGTLQLATAGQIDAAQAAEIQANAMNAFGIGADQAMHVADVLANAEVGSSAGITDIAQALQQVGGISKGFGENLEDTVAALGMFANAGIKGSDAGTLLKTTLQSITDQGNPAQEAINNLGLSLYNFDTGQFVGFRELFRQLDEAKARMSPQAFQAQSNILFGSDAMRSAMLGDVQTFDQMVAVINRAGTASDMAKAKMRGLPGVVEGISNSMEGLKLGVYDAIDAITNQMGLGLVSGLEDVGKWVDAHQSDTIGFITSFVDRTAFLLDATAGFVSGSLRLFGNWVNGVGSAAGVVLNMMGSTAKSIGSLMADVPEWLAPGMKDVGAAISAAGIEASAVGTVMSGAGNDLIKLASGIDTAREAGRGFAADIVAAGEQARVAAKLTDSLGGAVATLPDGKTITIESNSPDVQKRLEDLGFKVENLPNGQMTIVPKDEEARRVYDAWVQQAKNPIIIEVKARVDDYNKNLMAWINAVRSGRDPGPMPTPPQTGFAPAAPAAPAAPSFSTPSPTTSGGGFSSGAGDKLSDAPVLPLNYTNTAGLTAEMASAQNRVDETAHDLAEKQARLQQLQASNVATAEEIQSASNDVAKAEQDHLQAQQRFAEQQQNAYESQLKAMNKGVDGLKGAASGLDSVGAALDNDFGLSKGLPGFAENLTKFLANLAFAPMFGQLSAIAEANPSKGGHGLLGILGAQGAFGSRFTGIEDDTRTTGTVSPSSLGPVALQPSNLKDTGSVPSGPQSRTAAALVEQYFGSQLRGPIGGSRDNNTVKGTHDAGLSIDIPIGADQKSLGDQIEAFLQQNAGALGLKYTIWRDKGKYPGGGGFNQGGHQDHIDAHFNGRASGPMPVTVASGGSLWDAVMKQEGGTWDNQDTGNNGHFGGLQFAPETWRAFGGVDLTGQSNPANATREQQIAIANRTAFTGYNGTPPQGLAAWQAITDGKVPGVTVDTPASAFGTGTAPAPAPVVATPAPALSGFGSGIPIPLPVTIVGGAMAMPGYTGAPVGAPGGVPIGTPASGVGLGPAPGPAPGPVPGGGVPAAGGPGTGAGFPGMTGPPAAGPTQIGGVAPGGNAASGGGGIGIMPGGMIDTALQAGGMALDAFAPGAGQAAQTGIKLANRAIQYGAQVASIGVSGLMETFLPTGGSELANNNWATRILGGLAGAAPALPNLAGQKAPPPPNGADPQHQGTGAPPGPQNGVYIEKQINTRADGMGVANDVAWHQSAANTGTAGPVR